MLTLIRTEGKSDGVRAPGVRMLLLTDRPDGLTARRLLAFGSCVDVAEGFQAALSGIVDDPMGYDLLVIDCDGFGGIAAGERAIAFLITAGARMRVMLISKEFDVPAYPLGRRTAVCLPTAVAESVFQRGLDHALRDMAAVTLN